MKKVFLFISFALIWASAIAQFTPIDSTWNSNVNGVFFENRLIRYETGNSTLTANRIGDTLQVVSGQVSMIQEKAASIAADMEVVSKSPDQTTELIRISNATKLKMKRAPVDEIVAAKRGYFVDSIFSIRDGSVTRKVVFSFTAQNVFRYKIDTFAIRQATCLGNILRLQNYLNTGKSLDLYLFKNARWYSSTRTVQLYTKGVGPGATKVSAATTGMVAKSLAPGITTAELTNSPGQYETLPPDIFIDISTDLPTPKQTVKTANGTVYILQPKAVGNYYWDGEKLTKKK